MFYNGLAAVVLAAGLGSRMKSNSPKILCKVNGQPMVIRTVKTAFEIAGFNTIVVIGYLSDVVKRIISDNFDVIFAYQKSQMGTAHAVFCSMPFLSNKIKNVIILCGDVPLLRALTVKKFIEYHNCKNNDISVLAAYVSNPKGYGRVIINKNGEVDRIVEDADASDKDKKGKLINTGVFCVKKSCLSNVLNRVRNENKKKEFYLTDAIRIGRDFGMRIGVKVSSNDMEVVGINTVEELIMAESVYNIIMS